MPIATLATVLVAAAAPNYATLLERALEQYDTPGIAAVVSHRDDVVFAGGAGFADIESKRAMNADTVLYAGSLSKIFTATMTLHLVEQGKLSLDDSVPGIATGRGDPAAITIAHLLTHASGLPREGNFGYWFSADFPNRKALAERLAKIELRSEPGVELHYSNLGYARLGMVIEDVLDMSFAKALDVLLIQPLGLRATGTPGPARDVATGYTPTGRMLPNSERPFAGIAKRVGERHIREYHDAAAMSPAFGIYTTARDLGTLARFLLHDGEQPVLSAELRRRMRTRQASGWGLGLKVEQYRGIPVARHEGWFAAHRSHLLLDPARRLSVVVLTNSDGGAPARIAEKLYNAALAKIGDGSGLHVVDEVP